MRSRLELGRGGTSATHASLACSAARRVCGHRAQNSRTTSRHVASSFVRSAPARRAGKRPPPSLFLWHGTFQLEDPPVQVKGRAMALDDKTRTELEADAFRRLVEHLRKRTD